MKHILTLYPFKRFIYFILESWFEHVCISTVVKMKARLKKTSAPSTVVLVFHRFCHPIEVGWISIFNFNRNHFSNAVRMIVSHICGQCVDIHRCRFYHQQILQILIDATFPLVNRLNARYYYMLTQAANLFEMTARASFFADSSFGVVTQQIELEPGVYGAAVDCVLDILECNELNDANGDGVVLAQAMTE